MSKITSREGGVPSAVAPRWEKLRDQFLQEIAPDSHFHRAFDDFDDIVFFAKNLAGETLFFSRGVLQHHGLERDDEMIGRTDAELTPGALANQYCADDRRVTDSGEPLTGPSWSFGSTRSACRPGMSQISIRFGIGPAASSA